jgi:hypothetical protein
MKRMIFTWRTGEVGMEGTRLVSDDGTFTVCGRTYASELLKPHAGSIIMFWDHDYEDGRLSCFTTMDNGPRRAPLHDKWICYARQVKS